MKEPELQKQIQNDVVIHVGSQLAAEGYDASQQWLETSKPDEVRNRCIVEFAHSIAEDHPDTAADWVKQITYDDTRKFMLKEVYQKGNFSNDGEREAFASKYGIE